MATHLRVYDKDKTPLGLLPDHSGLTVQRVHNAPGTLTCDYPLSGVNASLLDRDIAYLAVIVNGVESPDWFVLDDDTDDPAAQEGTARPLRVAARSLMALLEWAEVYPKAHTPGANPNGMKPEHDFTAASPGLILKTLIDRAKARGVFPNLTYSFTDTTDSAGAAWPKTYDITYPAGTNYLDLLLSMCEAKWVDARTNGFELQVYAPGTVIGADKTATVQIKLAQQVTQGPRKRSRRGILSHLLGVGQETNMVEVVDAGAQATYGRREGTASDGRMTTNGSLSNMASSALSDNNKPKEALSLNLALDPPAGETWPIPGTDFTVGDKIGYDQRRLSSGAFEALQVKTITWSWGSQNDPPSCTVELNDVFLPSALRLKTRLDGLWNRSPLLGTLPRFPTETDTTVPKAPGVPTVTSYVYAVATGGYRAGVHVTWAAVTRNTNESDYLDHSQYVIQYQLASASNPWVVGPPSSDPEAWLDGFIPGGQIKVRVAAMDSNGHVSTWAESGFVTLANDATPPPAPSVLTATTRLGTVTVTWDGKDSTGAAMPSDFDFLAVYRSTDPAVVAPNATFLDRIYVSGGQVVVTNLPYGTQQFFTAVAVDKAGNVGAVNTAASVTPVALVDTDVIGKVLSGAKLIDQSVDGSTSIKAGSIGTSRLDVGSLQGNLQPNPNFEEADVADPTKPAGWTGGGFTGAAATIGFETASPIQGTKSMLASFASDANRQGFRVLWAAIPAEPGSQWLVSGKVRSSRAVTGKTAKLMVSSAANKADVFGGTSTFTTVVSADHATTVTTLSGVYTVPAGANYIGLYLNHDAPADAAGAYTVTWDQVSIQKQVVSAVIADGQITTPKLAALAVDAGKIAANAVKTDKLDAGAVTADKVALGVMRSNLVPDPSFEENYTMGVWAPFDAAYGVGNPYQWRLDNVQDPTTTASKSTAGRARSGAKALTLRAGPGVGSGAVSGAFPVDPAKTYKLVVNAGSLESTAKMAVSIETGNGGPDSPWYYSAGTLTGDSTWADPAMLATDATGVVDPDSYQGFSWDFTVPAGATYAIVRIVNFGPAAWSTLVVDDVSVVEKGIGGAAEVTAAGLRLFGPDGTELAAFVSNRPNYFSIARATGETVATIDQDGRATFSDLSSVNDPEFEGTPLLGNFADFRSPTENGANVRGHLDKLPRGVVAFGESTSTATFTTRRGLFELAFLAQRGRSYRVQFSGAHVTLGAANTVSGYGVRWVNPVTIDSEAPGPSFENGQHLMFSQGAVDVASTAITLPAQSKILRCNANGDTNLGGELRAGIVKVFLYLTGDLASIAMSASDIGAQLSVEELGPDIPLTHVTNTSTPGSPASTTTKKTYTSTWEATSWASYKGDGTTRTDTSLLVQGYESAYGDQYATVVCAGNAIDGETSKSISTALAGATVKKIEVLLQAANTSVRPTYGTTESGVTAIIRPYNSLTLANTVPTGASVQVPGWLAGQGKTVDITAIATASIRGFSIGPAGSQSLTYSGKFYATAPFSGHPKVRITYVR